MHKQSAVFHDAVLEYVERDFAYDVPRGENGHRFPPYRMELRFIRTTTLEPTQDTFDFAQAQQIAQKACIEAQAEDYRAERGIDEDLAGDEYREELDADADDDIDMDYDPDAVDA